MSVMSLAENQRPNLKPFRDVHSSNKIGLFAHTSGSVNKGTVVKISAADGNTNVFDGASSPATPYLKAYTNASDNHPSHVYSNSYEVSWKVDTAGSGDKPLGFLLNDVRTQDSWGNDMHWEHQKRAEGDIVESGQAVQVATKGLLTINGIQGTVVAGDAAYVSATVAGEVDRSSTHDKTRNDYVGTFLTTKDADGFAIIKVEL